MGGRNILNADKAVFATNLVPKTPSLTCSSGCMREKRLIFCLDFSVSPAPSVANPVWSRLLWLRLCFPRLDNQDRQAYGEF